MNQNADNQINLINKVKNYLNYNFSRLNLVSSGLTYFAAFGQNTSFGLMKYWTEGKIGYFIKLFLKEVYALIIFHQYKIISSTNDRIGYKKLIITWGSNKNFDKNGIYYDNYFNTDSSIMNDTLWFVIFSGANFDTKLNTNIIVFIKEKKINYAKNIYILIKSLIFNIFSFNKLINLISWQSFYANNLLEKFKLIKLRDLNSVLLPYEGQPFQTSIINYLKNSKKLKINGFIHSYPSLPTNLIKRKISPDNLIVASDDQKYCLSKFFGWNEKNIYLKESSRFINDEKKNMKNKIYLPINFVSAKKILNLIDILFHNLKHIDYNQLTIQNHPACKNSKKHIYLSKKLSEKIKYKKKNNNSDFDDKISIFIGSTGSIVEALDSNIKVYHICEDVVMESYNKIMWPSINFENINNNIIIYQKNTNYKLIKIGNKNTAFSYFN
ncbi:hypothetical protein N9T21_00540 [Candidatus Pelagibacter sp.]|nr:hypothetical protein [Candidatus Pelagibacter sp.]